MNKKILRVTFKGVGPLTRSTIGNDMSDPDGESIEDTLHWIWSWQVQLERFHQSTKFEWNIDQGSQSGLECRKISSRASFDEHMLLVVGRNFLRAIDGLPKKLRNDLIPKDTRQSLQFLRNIYEHWDEQRDSFRNSETPKKHSGKEFSKEFPNGKPWSITYEKNDYYIAGVFGLNDFSKNLLRLENRLLEHRPVQET